MKEKLTAELPRVRISERMERDAMRAAAREDRSLSDWIRHVLAHELYGAMGMSHEDRDDV